MIVESLMRHAAERARHMRPDAHVRPESVPHFGAAIAGRETLSVIAEFKRRSPSEGAIADRPLIDQVSRYARAGAAALSILTEPTRFGGSVADLSAAAKAVSVPLIMKDFVVAPVQVAAAAAAGASAVLVIVRFLDDVRFTEIVAACLESGVVPLTECHGEDDIERALEVDEAIIGVNNRDLTTMRVDIGNAPRLLARVPERRITVAESGYAVASDVASLAGLADAVLVGTSLMRSEDPEALIRSMVA